jgi:DNA polymerase III subunit delta'
MPWSDLIGNARAAGALAIELANGSRVHSYIFAGPEHVGKATAARLLAQALNCTGEAPPCGDCDACRRIAAANHADVHTMTLGVSDEGKVKRDISVEQIREMDSATALAPFQGRMRVVIIDPAAAMSPGAQNAFLKTLEEPPAHAMFILITTDAEHLLDTVRSRCRLIEFGLVSSADIEDGLRARGVDSEQAAVLARLAAGRPGWAIEAASSPRLLERRDEALDAARSLTAMHLAERIDLAERMSDAFKRDRARIDDQLEVWLGWWRDVLLHQSGAPEAIANIDRASQVASDASDLDPADVRSFVEALRHTREILRANVQSRIALDALMLAVPGALSASRR